MLPDSRIFGGVHFRSSTVDGVRLGRAVGARVFDRIKPVGQRVVVGTGAAQKPAGVATEGGKVQEAPAGRRMVWAE
jgi:hypothetical protein